MDSETKILLITAVNGSCDQTYGDEPPTIETREVSLDDPTMEQMIRDAGWIKLEEQQTIDKTLKPSDTFYWFYTDKSYGTTIWGQFQLHNLYDRDIKDLAQGKKDIVRAVDKKSFKALLTPHQLRVYTAAVSEQKVKKQKEIERKRKTAATKKAKKVEQAKKILREAGELE